MTSTILASFPSPDRGVWHIGFIPIRAYALCIIAGIVAALVIGDRRWAARGGQQGVIYDIALWAVPFGLIGGRLYHVMTDWPTYFGPDGFGFFAALRIWDGGLGIWGAVALGAVGAWIGCRQRDIPLPAFGDAIAPGIILAQAIGRLGNYFNQELYGGPTDLPWGLEIYERVLPNGKEDRLNGVSTGQLLDSAPVPVHPTFLYELLWNLLVFAMLLWADRRFRLGHGRLFALYVAGYCVGRFGIELLRQDHASLIAGVRVNTFTSAIVFLGAVLYIVLAAKGREAPDKLWGRSPEVAAPEGAEAQVSEASVGGLGSVDGDDVIAAEGDAVKVHDEAIEQAEVAEATAAEVADEPQRESEAAVGTVESGGGAATVDELPGTATVDVASGLDSTVDEAVSEAGLGSVDGDDVIAAEGDAVKVHDEAIEQAEVAEATAAEVADEPQRESEAAVGTVESGGGAATVDELPGTATVDVASGLDSTVDEAVSEAGLGSVDGDDVIAAEGDAVKVHDEAIEQAEVAEATAAEVADEPQPGPAEPPARARRRWLRRGG